MTVPLIGPLVRQLVRTNDDCRINHWVLDHLDVCDGVTAVRCVTLDGEYGVGIERMTQDCHGLTLDDVTLDIVVVRLVNREVEDRDRVTTVGSHRGITIYATLSQVLSLEGVEVALAFADTVVDSDYNRIVNNESQAVEHLLSVDVGGIIAVEAVRIELRDLTIPLVDPLVRQIVRTYIDGSINERMNNDFQYGGTVTTVRCYSLLGINGVGREGLTICVQRLSLDDVLLAEAIVSLVNREVEDDD